MDGTIWVKRKRFWSRRFGIIRSNQFQYRIDNASGDQRFSCDLTRCLVEVARGITRKFVIKITFSEVIDGCKYMRLSVDSKHRLDKWLEAFQEGQKKVVSAAANIEPIQEDPLGEQRKSTYVGSDHGALEKNRTLRSEKSQSRKSVEKEEEEIESEDDVNTKLMRASDESDTQSDTGGSDSMGRDSMLSDASSRSQRRQYKMSRADSNEEALSTVIDELPEVDELDVNRASFLEGEDEAAKESVLYTEAQAQALRKSLVEALEYNNHEGIQEEKGEEEEEEHPTAKEITTSTKETEETEATAVAETDSNDRKVDGDSVEDRETDETPNIKDSSEIVDDGELGQVGSKSEEQLAAEVAEMMQGVRFDDRRNVCLVDDNSLGVQASFKEYSMFAQESYDYFEQFRSTADWVSIGSKKGVDMYKYLNTQRNIYASRSETEIKAPLTTILTFAQSLDLKKKYDGRYKSGDYMEIYKRGISVTHHYYNGVGILVAPRDFVILSHARRVDKDTVMIIAKSVDSSKPSPRKSVRGEIVIAGWIFTRKPGDEEIYQCSYIQMSDPKGSLPTSIIGAVLKDQCMVVYEFKKVIEADR
mmetsp:Transcript_65492/g.75331  ORF Transcript_65492/g.75331 Transcript_65492/m.75331 type:complete len:588 (+) Transcript_65492:78-1841(+)